MLSRVPTRALRQVTTLVSCMCAIVSIGSCDKVPLLAPTESVITVVSDRAVVPINGTAQIVATVIEQGGTPAHNGTLVTFTTTLGTLDPREAVTNNGQAVVTLRAGTASGTAEIGAFSGSARTEAPVMIAIGGAAAAALTLSANPAAVPPTGATVTIVAAVTDASGNLLTGVPVSFTTSAGTLASVTVVTDSSGEARTTLTTDRETTVTATAGAFSSSVAIGLNALPSVTIVATPTTTSVGEPVTFAVSVTAGSSAIREVSVNFGDGTARELGALDGATNVAHNYTFAGTFQVVATVTDSSSATVTVATIIVVQAALPLNVNLSASPSPGTVDEVVTFTATATGTTVPIATYAWNFGDGTTVTTSGNVVNHVFTTAATRTVTVTVTTIEGATGSTQITLIIVPLQVEVTLAISPLTANALQTVSFTATVTPATVVVTNYAWDFGDAAGTTSNTSGRTTTHSYQNADKGLTRTVTVEITTTPNGDKFSTQGVVTINP